LGAGRTLLIDLDSQASASLSLSIDRAGFNLYIADVIKKRLEG
jgi:cellulose biosynthesis protein BcsQ